MQWCINYKWLWTVITKTKILINLTTWFFSLFVVLIKIIQIFFQILVHCMIWCDDGLPKNSRAKLYSVLVLLFHRHNFFLSSSSHSSFYTFLKQGVPMCFWRCQKNTSFFWREIQFRHLASDNTLRSKKIPRNAIFLLQKMH